MSERVTDKNVLWKACGAGGDKKVSFDYDRSIHGDNSDATKFGLVVDLETAKALVLTVPTSPLASIPADLVYFEKMQDAQTGSVELAIEKARTAALFRRPTKVFEDGVAAGGEGLRLLRLTGAIPIDGGVPIIVDGKVVGAVGVSGGSGAQDGQVAKAGANAVK
jgi:uncharacterized protein GlcG (DUF336 family)